MVQKLPHTSLYALLRVFPCLVCPLLWFNKVLNLLRTQLPWLYLHLECRISPACRKAFKTGEKCVAMGRRVSAIAQTSAIPGNPPERRPTRSVQLKGLLLPQHWGQSELNYTWERDWEPRRICWYGGSFMSLKGIGEQTERMWSERSADSGLKDSCRKLK